MSTKTTPREGYLEAFATFDGAVMGIFATGGDTIQIDYVNDGDALPLTVAIKDIDALTSALDRVAEMLRPAPMPDEYAEKGTR